ncbi:MAG: hypothetical protein D6722_09050 [Bacteroidetes bacterium]|nr:MAG: hypothetical protein D6722_09050 [Bacteroidota bacterium]
MDEQIPFTHSYVETQCADPWVGLYTGSRDETSEAAMLEYLAEAGIVVLNSRKVTASEQVVCMACTCPSNSVFEVAVADKDVADLEALGFTPL